MKSIVQTLVVVVSVLFLFACGGGSGSSANGGRSSGGGSSVTSISVSPSNASVAPGGTQKFAATAHNGDGTTADITTTAIWSVSASSIATVDTTGNATGVSTGTALITATSGTISGSATLQVTAAVNNLSSIAVTPASPTVVQNTSQAFTATGTYSNGSTADLTGLVVWSSSNTSVATIDATGLASTTAAGTTTITATLGSISGNTTLTVSAPTLSSLVVTPDDLTLAIGIPQQYIATGTFSDGSTVDLTSGVTWTSSATGVATIDGSGLAKTVGSGTTTITATVGSISDTAALTVLPASLVSITLTPQNSSIALGTNQQFTAIGNFDDGSTQLLSNATWSSSATNVAIVDANGLATSTGSGTTTITVQVGTISANTSLIVINASLVSIAVTPPSPTAAPGTTRQFTATGTFSDSTTQNITTSVVWSSSNPAVASINGKGLASAIATGTTTIKATFGTIFGSTVLTVNNVSLVSITVLPANPRISKGNLLRFTARGNYSDGSTSTSLAGVSWKSGSPNIANIRQSGIAQGKRIGTATITAKVGALTGSTTLTVGSGTLVSIAVTPATPNVAAGTPVQFTATGTFSDATTQDVSIKAHWGSSNSGVATVANAPSIPGLATTISAGTTTIKATSGSVSGNTVLTVH